MALPMALMVLTTQDSLEQHTNSIPTTLVGIPLADWLPHDSEAQPGSVPGAGGLSDAFLNGDGAAGGSR